MTRPGNGAAAPHPDGALTPVGLSAVVASSARATRQKRALAEALDDLEEFATAQELYLRLCEMGARVGLGTIYRQLHELVRHGEIDSVRSESGEVLYRRCRSSADHFRLCCQRCGRTVELHAPELEVWAGRAGPDVGFSALTSTLEISGICDQCAAPAATGSFR